MDIIGGIVDVTLKIGVTVQVTPLSPLLQRRIVNQSSELFPLPDPKLYETPIEDALVPGSTAPASQNPDYRAALAQVHVNRLWRTFERILALCVTHPQADAIAASYAPQVEKARKSGELLEETDDSPFTVVLRNFLVTEDDQIPLMKAAQLAGEITEGEVAEGRKFFRLDVRDNGRAKIHRNVPERRQTSDLSGRKEGQSELTES